MSRPQVVVLQADSLKWLKTQSGKGELFDCIITDPPYDSLLKWQGVGTTARMGFGAGKDATKSDKFYPCIGRDDMREVMIAFGRLLRANRHCYVMADHEYMPVLLAWARNENIGFDYAKPLVWDKVTPGMGYHWRSRHEYIVMFEKGKRRLNDLRKADVLQHKRVTGGYPTEKPLGLVEELLLNSTQPGEWVLDPFAGSGVVAEACLRHGRNCVVIDISDRAITCIKNRLAGYIPINVRDGIQQ